jgi:hypothetical protein
MNRLFITAALIFAGIVSLQARIVVDCRNIPYTNLIERVTAGEFKNMDGIVVTAPFKTFPSSTLIYDYRDTGNTFQQGRFGLPYGSIDELKSLQTVCKKFSIRLMSQVKLFDQAPGYNLSFWQAGDFLPDEAIYRDTFLVDISRASGRIDDAVRNMQRAPVDVWIVDMTSVPYALIADYDRAVRRSFSANRFLHLDRDQLRRSKPYVFRLLLEASAGQLPDAPRELHQYLDAGRANGLPLRRESRNVHQ